MFYRVLGVKAPEKLNTTVHLSKPFDYIILSRCLKCDFQLCKAKTFANSIKCARLSSCWFNVSNMTFIVKAGTRHIF